MTSRKLYHYGVGSTRPVTRTDSTYNGYARLSLTTTSGGATDQYGYDTQNRRFLKQSNNGHTFVYFYDIAGRRTKTYKIVCTGQNCQPRLQGEDIYFAGRLIVSNGAEVVTDSLGSVRVRNGATLERFKYYPYGEENGTSASNRDKFGTYHRDQNTGFDYADQRYYSSITGRFLTPDPADAGDVDDPQSLNLYTYAGNDAVNFNDPEGTTVNIPLEDGGSPTDCLNYKIMPWVKSHGFSIDDNFNDFASTGVGTLGLTLYYESTGGSTQLYQQMAQVMANRYWLANSDPNLAKKLGLPVWGSSQKTKDSRVSYIAMHTSQDWDSKGNLKAIKNLEHILFGEVAASWAGTNRANCDHLISALNVAYDANRTIFANRGAHYSGTYLDTYWFFQGKNDPVDHNYWNTSTYSFQGWNFERYIAPKVPKKK